MQSLPCLIGKKIVPPFINTCPEWKVLFCKGLVWPVQSTVVYTGDCTLVASSCILIGLVFLEPTRLDTMFEYLVYYLVCFSYIVLGHSMLGLNCWNKQMSCRTQKIDSRCEYCIKLSAFEFVALTGTLLNCMHTP